MLRAVGDQPAHPLESQMGKLGQFQLSFLTEQACEFRSSGESQRQGPDTPETDREKAVLLVPHTISWASIKAWIEGLPHAPIRSSHDLFSQSSPIGRSYISAGEGAGCERDDLVDLAAGDFYFDGGVQEVG